MNLYEDVSDIANLESYGPFKEHVMAFLGDGLISVEIGDDQVVPAFYRAREIYKQRGTMPDKKQFVALDVEKDIREYDIPVDNVETIVEVIQTKGGFRSEDPFHYAIINDFFFGSHSSGRDMFLYDLTMQQMEILKKYSSFHRQWIHHYRSNKIEFLKAPHANERWFLEAYTSYTNEEFMNMTWIQRYTIAECKCILGRAYRKFSTLSTPAGDIQLDGSDLVQEGTQEKEELIEEMKNFVDSGRPNGWGIIKG